MKTRVGRFIGIAKRGEVNGVFFDGERKQRARHAMEADRQAGMPRKSCAIGVDRHGDDLPGAGLKGNGRAA